MRRVMAGALLSGILALGAARPQGAGHARSRSRPSGRACRGVTVAATVRDGRGRIVRNLKKNDFEVHRQRRRAADSADSTPANAPISLAVLLDISGSMAVGGNMERARQAVACRPRPSADAADEAALFTFDYELQRGRRTSPRTWRVSVASV